MRDLLKAGLLALTLLFLAGCGSSSNSNTNGDDDITRFLSDFPTIDASGYTVINEHKSVDYYDNTSELAVDINATISARDFNLTYWDYNNADDFWYAYDLNTPESKGLNYAYADIWSVNDSNIQIQCESNSTIPNGKFAELFGSINANLFTGVNIETAYDGDMSVKFAEYLAEFAGSGKFFDTDDTVNVSCNTDGTSFWNCSKNDGGVVYYFRLEFDGTFSRVIFDKRA